MRILYLIYGFQWGGAEKLVFDLTQNLIPDVEWIGVVSLYKHNTETEREMIQMLELHGINTFMLEKQAASDRIRSIKKLYHYAKDNHVELIHGHCSVPMLFAKIVGKILQIPVVCTIHNTNGYSRKQELLTSWMVDSYISIGQAAEDYMLHELKIKKRKISRIYNAIDIDRFSQSKRTPDFWSQYGGKEGEIVLLNVARVAEQKNQLCLLRALKILVDQNKTNFRIYFLGNYEAGDETACILQDYIQENGLQPYVVFLGMHKNVNDFLVNADCFVMTSWYEGLSVAFLEAVICGLPIVVTDMPFVKELNQLAECAVIIPQDDDHALAGVLAEGMFHRQTDQTIQTFKENFSMDRFVSEHLQVYQTLLSATKKGNK